MCSSDLVCQPRRILVVDDNADAAEMLKAFLDLRGHTVRIAHDGEAALRLIDSFTPDIAFLDINMPKASGLEVARVRPPGTVIVFLTAFNELTVSALLWSSGRETLGVVVFGLEQAGESTAAAAVAVLTVAATLEIGRAHV